MVSRKYFSFGNILSGLLHDVIVWSIDNVHPVEIDFEELQLEEVIGVGGFGKVYR